MKIILSGGGTLGSVTPLLAVAEELRKLDSETEFLWIGTRKGPEKKLVEENQIPFKSIVAGKWRRYFSLKNFIDLFKVDIGFWQSLFILRKFKPDVFISAGGFVSVPTAVAAALLRVPILIHQQDVVPGFANKLMMPIATKITVSLDVPLNNFPKEKIRLIGNPVRLFIFQGDAKKVREKLKLQDEFPTLLVMGGGTGAKAINELVIKTLPELTKFCQVIHLTGKGKTSDVQKIVQPLGGPRTPSGDTKSKWTPDVNSLENYHFLEFTTSEMPDFYAAADLIISRAGMSSLSEICALGKPSIIIPIPKSHQEKNAEYFAGRGAVKLFRQSPLMSSSGLTRGSILDCPIKSGNDKVEEFVNLVRELLFNQPEREKLSENAKRIMPQDAAQKMAEIAKSLAK